MLHFPLMMRRRIGARSPPPHTPYPLDAWCVASEGHRPAARRVLCSTCVEKGAGAVVHLVVQTCRRRTDNSVLGDELRAYQRLLLERVLQHRPAMLQADDGTIEQRAREVRVAEDGEPILAVERHPQPQCVVLAARPYPPACIASNPARRWVRVGGRRVWCTSPCWGL